MIANNRNIFRVRRYKEIRLETHPSFRFSSIHNQHFILLLLYLALVSIGLFRSVGVSERFTFVQMSGRFLTIILMSMTAYYVFRVYAVNNQFALAWNLITIGIGIYVIANVASAALGIENPFHETLYLVTDDAILSFWDTRIIFPFSANHQSFAIESGLFASLLIARLLRSNCPRKPIYFFMLLLALGAVIACNTRMPYIGVLSVVLIGMTWKKIRWEKYIPFGFCMILILPLLITFVDSANLLEQLPIDLSFLSRKQDLSTIATLNNRTMIWEVAFDELKNFKMIHLVGYGAFGHVASEMSYQYGGTWKDPGLISLHNTYLQHVIDIGYIGLLIFVAIIVNIINKLSKIQVLDNSPAKVFHPALAAMVYLAVCSLTDICIIFNQSLLFFVFLLLNFQVIWFDIPKSASRHKLSHY